jgi:hypothetical protein
MARLASILALALLALAAAHADVYWGAPNSEACPFTGEAALTCTSMVDNCSGRVFSNKQSEPSTLSNSFLQIQRLSVPENTFYELKEFHMVYTHKWLPLAYLVHDGLNFTVNVWNSSRADPNRAVNWLTPLVSFQRVLFFRGSDGQMWNSAYRMYGNVSATMGGPIKLSAGEYLFSINGYMTANPATYANDAAYQWYQTPERNPYYANDSFIQYVGNLVTYKFSPLSWGPNNGTSWWTSTPGRTCSWTAGALTNLTDGSVNDPTLKSTLNLINYVVRYNFKVPITQINVTDFMVRMNDYFNVAAYSPYASVHVYSVQRQFTCCSWIDWYINTSFGRSLMAQGLGLSEETIANATGMPTNNLPGQIWGWTKDT